MQSREKAKPPIHYTWVGLPSAHDKIGVAGHDVACVINMAKALPDDRTVSFWCLAEYLEYYEEHLKEHTNINVQSIESLITQHAQQSPDAAQPAFPPDYTLQDAAAGMQACMDTLLAKAANTIRDRVAVKNLFAIYLLMIKGGYCLDTNIEPIRGQAILLDGEDTFTVAGYDLPSSPNNKKVTDCFLMFSPNDTRGSVNKMIAIFKVYVNAIHAAQESRKESFEAYCYNISGPYMTAITQQEPAFFVGRQCGKRPAVEFEIGVKKYYFNTHREQFFRTKVPLFYRAIEDFNIARVEAMIRLGEDVNRQLVGPSAYQGKTSLHWAVRCYYRKMKAMKNGGEAPTTDIIICLLTAGADKDVETSYRGRMVNAIQLAHEYAVYYRVGNRKLPFLMERTAALLAAFDSIGKIINARQSSGASIAGFDSISQLLQNNEFVLEDKLKECKKVAKQWLASPANTEQHDEATRNFFLAIRCGKLDELSALPADTLCMHKPSYVNRKYGGKS